MRKSSKRSGNFVPAVAGVASIIIGVFTLAQMVITSNKTPGTSMTIVPEKTYAAVGDTIRVDVRVNSNIPVNAFTGTLFFDESFMTVDSISYEPSIANLWAKEPWHINGGGQILFTGGTTVAGGFTGDGSLLVVTFKMRTPGTASMSLGDTKILQHDGLGSEAPLREGIDTIFTITSGNMIAVPTSTTALRIAKTLPSTDLDQNNSTTIGDIPRFVTLMRNGDLSADFDGDGRVTMSDFAILLAAI
jgi:hypothetical protein